ncbi:MAG: hypothetical protein QXW32_03195 [Nitrososphaerales archaeon]
MCELCGCIAYIGSGKQAVVKRALEIVKQLKISRENVDLFEDCERISYEVVAHSSPSSEESKILETCRWIHRLHEPIYRNWFPRYLNAAKDVFAKLPVEGDVKEVVTAYHQLEQLVKEIGDEELASLEEGVREALKAVKNVHENNLAKRTKLKERYSLE